MGSANDGQELLVNGAYQPVGSPLWRRAYGARVAEIMTSVVQEGAKLLWIGEPAMQDPQLSAYMQAMDEVSAAEAAKHPGVTFFNPGTVLNGPHGRYAATRLIDGQQVSTRLDGVHLNMAGSIYLANYIASYVAGLLPEALRPGPRRRVSPSRSGNPGSAATEAERGPRGYSREDPRLRDGTGGDRVEYVVLSGVQ